MKRLFTLFAAVCTFASAAIAQAPDGNIVFATTSGVFHMRPDLSAAATVWPGTGIGNLGLQSLKTAYGNQGLVGGDTSGNIIKISHGGTISTVGKLASGWATALDLDTDYRYICGAGTAGAVTMGISGGSSTFLDLGSDAVNGLCRNLKNGKYAVVTTLPSTYLAEITFNGASATRLTPFASSLGLPSGICYMPDVDLYAVTFLSTTNPVQLYRSNGSLFKSVFLPTNVRGNSCAYDQRTRQLYVGTQEGVIYRLRNDGTFIARRSTGLGSITGIDIYGDQRISVRVFGTNPTDMNVILFFRESKSKPYCLAISLGIAPGINVPGAGRINLLPDQLFFLTACGQLPFFTSGFTGTLRNTGSGNGFFTIPKHVPVGTPVYVSGVAIDASQPGGLALGNTETIIAH